MILKQAFVLTLVSCFLGTVQNQNTCNANGWETGSEDCTNPSDAGSSSGSSPTHWPDESDGTVTVTTCGDPDKALIKLKSFDYSPKPVVFPADLTLSIETEILEDIVAPVRVDTDMDLQAAGKKLKIPCLNGFGSCSVNDICGPLSTADCPSFITAQGYSCECPFSKGDYSISNITFHVPFGKEGAGTFHSKMNVYSNGVFALCLDLRMEY
ncbi:ganglioside gm2 activator [Plakobranchus ocellatus]|uniref:Ganglioside gm2 activator n=1 Tax=Plakobranchus ocellatus TaxID=259542 RepID=A0AAV3YH96_9GAST|nr:ganglioside gm2 activator [Plakobranchus ocellatus]